MRGARCIAVGTLLVLLLAGAVAWMQSDRLRAWWVIRGLSRAEETGRDIWLDRVAQLGPPAVGGLLECLTDGDDQASGNALAALDHLARLHGLTDSFTADLIADLVRCYPRLDPARQTSLLRTFTAWLATAAPADGVHAALARLFNEDAWPDGEIQAAGLELAAMMARQSKDPQILASARTMAQVGLRSAMPAVRLSAVQLCLQSGVELLDQVVGLLRDPSPEVRRAATLAVGPEERIVREEGLLPGLHDPDAEVRRLTEAALRARGLRPEHLELGRLLTHPIPARRLRVLDHISDALEGQPSGMELTIDPGVWLRRLSHDGSPAVRAAALRLMSEQQLIDLTDRIDQMARSDPSPSVSQLAHFYLAGRRGLSPPTER